MSTLHINCPQINSKVRVFRPKFCIFRPKFVDEKTILRRFPTAANSLRGNNCHDLTAHWSHDNLLVSVDVSSVTVFVFDVNICVGLDIACDGFCSSHATWQVTVAPNTYWQQNIVWLDQWCCGRGMAMRGI